MMINKEPVPVYLDYLYLLNSVRLYASPKAKITNMIKAKEIIKIRKGLYIKPDSSEYSLKTLANKIYGPSYISFEYALSYYNFIMERAETVTSASMGKNKNKIFNTPVGAFSYQSINRAAYPYGIIIGKENENPFLIATKEKALCDTLSRAGSVKNLKALKALLYDDLRIDQNMLFSINLKDMEFLVPLYKKKVLVLLLKYLKKEMKNV